MKTIQLTTLISFLMLTTTAFAQVVFQPVGQTAGLSTATKNEFGNPIWGDMNNDNYLDLIIPHHGNTPDIYLNNQDGTFNNRHVITTFGIDFFNEHNDFHGYSFTDYNKDNILDLFITMGARQGDPDFVKRDLLYQGIGNGSFTLVSTAAGVENPTGRGRSSCWFDYDGDGNLDFLQKNIGTPNAFYLNAGDGTFTNIADSIGMGDLEGAVCSLVDYDNDGRMDIFLVAGALDDTLLRQMSDGSFSDVTASVNIASLPHGTGVAWGDYNNDGHMDVYIARAAPSSYIGPMSELDMNNTLYTNNGDGTFTDDTVNAGVDGSFNTAGASWGDVDNDGYLDLLVVNAGENDGSDNNNFLYINNGNGTFIESAAQSNIDGQADLVNRRYTGLAFGDYDNNGFLDLILQGTGVNQGKGTSELYYNEGNSNNYIKVELKGARANSLAIGSVVSIDTVSSGQVRQYSGATNGVRFSQSQQPLHFGVATEESVSINVAWPAGASVAEQTISNIATNQTVVLEENRSIVRGRANDLSAAGCYIWRNFQGWNLRCIGEAGKRINFTGSITSNGTITKVIPLRIEQNDVITTVDNTIDFDLFASQGHDTIIFTTAGDTVSFEIYTDGVHQPRTVRIGKHKILPATLPVTLTE